MEVQMLRGQRRLDSQKHLRNPRRRLIVGVSLTMLLFGHKPLASSDFPHSISTMAVSPSGRFLAIGDKFRRVRLFSIKKNLVPMWDWKEVADSVCSIAFRDNEQKLCVMTTGGLHVLSIESGDEVAQTDFYSSAAKINAIAGLIAQTDGTKVVIRDLHTAKPLRELATKRGYPAALAFSPDGSMLAVGAQERIITLGPPAPAGTPDRVIELFSTHDGTVKNFESETTWFSIISLSDDTSMLAAVSFDRQPGSAVNDYRDTTLSVWSIRTGENVLSVPLRDDGSNVTSLSFTKNGERLVGTTASFSGGSIFVADIKAGRVNFHDEPFRLGAIWDAVLFNYDNNIALGVERTIELRGLPDFKIIEQFKQ